MKRNFIILIIAIILCVIPKPTKSQTLLFYDFESWRDATTNPTGWSASFEINIQSELLPIPIPVTMKFGSKNNANPYAGNFDLQISPYYFTMAGFTMPGIAQLGVNKAVTVSQSIITDLLSGNIDLSDPGALLALSAFEGLIAPGAAISGNPAKFKGFFRFLPAAESNDSARIIVTTTHWNSELGITEMVARGMLEIGNTLPTYKELSAPLAFSENIETGTVADSVRVFIIVGGTNPNVETKLFIDNFSLFSGTESITKNEPAQYSIYPNPASETISITSVNPHLPYSAKLFDISGKLVLENMSLIENSILDIKNVAKGVYLLELTQGQEKYTQKIVIQ